MTTARLRRALVPVSVLAILLAIGACEPRAAEPGYRAFTEHYTIRVSSEPAPPHARERTLFRVVVRDKETGQPIEGGEGVIYAETREGAKVYDTFTQGPEPGAYYATLNYVVAGEWAMGLQFRQDSTMELEQLDWMQDVLAERPAAP